MFKININNEQLEFNQEIRLTDLVNDESKEYPVALVNNRLRELSYKFNYDANVEFLTLANKEAMIVYETSLRYLVAMAMKNIYPKYHISFSYSVSRSIYIEIKNLKDQTGMNKIIRELVVEMKRLIELDLPFIRETFSKEEAIKFYEKEGFNDRIDLIKYRPETTVHFYDCDGYINYMYGYMVPSTGYLTKFKLRPYFPGMILQYPRSEENSSIPPFEDSPFYQKSLKEASKWAKTCDAYTISAMNQHVENESIIEFVHMCEAKHSAMLTEIGTEIEKDKDNIRLIAIAGPSSSGKTTFSTRLRIELMTRGLKPVTISLDNYYLDREDIEPDENGEVDLEHLNTLDIELFNQNMLDLINGEEVKIPYFDFKTKKRSGYKVLQIKENNPIIIEGIHALNEKLTSMIPKHQKYKIYISPILQINIDDHNPINNTNVRLLRRIVRDKKFRNAPAIRTISMWDSVRAGEFKWIYPHQEGANYIYNSGLTYELCVMKKYALPTLNEIPSDSEYYITANRLIKFIKYFVDIPDEAVPCNSLLREFIGGSCFED
ncbi:MAG: hypothetical protein QM489_03565 [Candidatus Izemoplasma sp.]